MTRQGGKAVTILLAPRTARVTGLIIGEWTEGLVFLARPGGGRGRHGTGRIVRTTARRAAISDAAR